MEICIGIISYLPDDKVVRSNRLNKLKKLITSCDTYLDLPIIIVAQNWREGDLSLSSDNCIIYSYKKPLGITGARRKLQEAFIKSKYDNLIMLDDDLEISGEQQSFDAYINFIKNNPDKYIKFKAMGSNTLLWFNCIPKSIYSKISYPNLDPCKGEIFEDVWLNIYINKNFKKFIAYPGNLGIKVLGNYANDPESTWYHGQFKKPEMSKFTRGMIFK